MEKITHQDITTCLSVRIFPCYYVHIITSCLMLLQIDPVFFFSLTSLHRLFVATCMCKYHKSVILGFFWLQNERLGRNLVFLVQQGIVSAGKLIWYKRNKSQWGMELWEDHQFQGWCMPQPCCWLLSFNSTPRHFLLHNCPVNSFSSQGRINRTRD